MNSDGIERDKSVCVLGLGYVGLPLAVAAVQAGFDVEGFDPAVRLVAALSAGETHVEDVGNSMLTRSLGRGLRLVSDTAALVPADVYVICVPTPLSDGAPDISFIEAAVRTVCSVLQPGQMLILESTTYPGTTEDVVMPLVADLTGLQAGRDYHLAFSPERIDPGNPEFRLENTPKIVGGHTPEATERAAAFYAAFVAEVHRVRGPKEAELAKLLENTFRHVNIALVNEMAIFCRELDIDINAVIDAASTKPFGYMPFRPGPGVGGHCIPVDPSYLSWKVRRLGYSFRFVELAQEVNARMPNYVVTRVTQVLNARSLSVRGSRILLVGVAYKADVSDTRESPAFPIAEQLVKLGALVTWHDPHVSEFRIAGAELEPVEQLTEYVLANHELVLVVTPHASVDWALLVASGCTVLDTRQALKEHAASDNIETL